MSIAKADDRILAALEDHLNQLFDAPPIAFENVQFTPPDGPWLRGTILPGQTAQGSMGDDGYNTYQGLYQVSVFTPRNTGRAQALELVTQIIEHFHRGRVLDFIPGIKVRIGVASRLAAQTEANWYHVPVQIAWTAHANP